MKRRSSSSNTMATKYIGSDSISKRYSFGARIRVPREAVSGREDYQFASDYDEEDDHNDRLNYVLLIALYTLQGIPMGLSASIPFLIQQKVKSLLSSSSSSSSAASTATDMVEAAARAAMAASHTDAARLSYQANAIFALCSWPFSFKLLWAPIVDAVFVRAWGRRKSWLVPVQCVAGFLMVLGSNFVERQLGSGSMDVAFHVQGVTAFFFVLYFLMATQDIAVDGWALTMLSKKNRGRGPVCNSIGQNIGYFLSFVGFLALNDIESSENLWRPLFGIASNPTKGLVSLGGFIRFMGYFMLVTTFAVAMFKREIEPMSPRRDFGGLPASSEALLASDRMHAFEDDNDDKELDASEIGLRETYHRLWEVCKLPSVRRLFLILMTYRLPTALSDNVKFLKAVELGLSKSATALLSPTVILPLGILVPIVATRIWHGHPLRQFMMGYQFRVTLVPLFDLLMLQMLRRGPKPKSPFGLLMYWSIIVLSTAAQAITNSLQVNAQMTFFASRVDPAIGGSYMTLLNTAANLGGTWPSSIVLWLIGRLTHDPVCTTNELGQTSCTEGRDPYVAMQLGLSVLGCLWIMVLGRKVKQVAELPAEAWQTHLLDSENTDDLEMANPLKESKSE